MTTRRVILRPAAEADLTALYHSIAERSGYPERAIAYIRRTLILDSRVLRDQ
jgi:plasmid stabilization system protein ParE